MCLQQNDKGDIIAGWRTPVAEVSPHVIDTSDFECRGNDSMSRLERKHRDSRASKCREDQLIALMSRYLECVV